MTPVLLGLLGAVLIGGSDVVARVTAQRVSLSILFLAVMGLSFVVLTLQLALTGNWPAWHWWGWTASAVSGLLNLVALGFLYKALARGPVTIASPAASSFAVMLVVINMLAGEPVVWLQGLAVLVVFAGIAMLSRRDDTGSVDAAYDPAWLRTTALFGLAAGASIALRMFLAQEAGSALGVMPALYLNRVFATLGAVGLIAIHLSRRESLRWPTGRLVPLVLLQALLETLALAAFLFGSAQGGRISATIGFSAFAAVSAIVARIWLGDPIGLRRGIWMSVVAAGIVLAVLAGVGAK